MTPTESAAVSPPSLRVLPASRWLRFAGLAVLGCVVSQYLAGFLFLASLHLDARTAGPLTIARYGYYYGHEAGVRSRLWGCSLGGLAVMAVVPLVLFLPRRRALHGAARFATHREVARAGLLGDRGIILGGWGRRCLMLAGQQGRVSRLPRAPAKGRVS